MYRTDMDTPQPDPSRRLRSLLKAAGITSFRLGDNIRGAIYSGRTREWLVGTRMNEHWFNAYVRVCNLPEEPSLRTRLMDTVMDMNRQMQLTKFIVSSGLVLELDYRAEHVDAEVLGNLILLLHANAEMHYPKIFRVVSGDETLAQLEAQLITAKAA